MAGVSANVALEDIDPEIANLGMRMQASYELAQLRCARPVAEPGRRTHDQGSGRRRRRV